MMKDVDVYDISEDLILIYLFLLKKELHQNHLLEICILNVFVLGHEVHLN